jgi:hypothetical protein
MCSYYYNGACHNLWRKGRLWRKRRLKARSSNSSSRASRSKVHPVTANGVRCVVVDVRLEQIEPMAYRFLLSFAKDNELRVRDGRVAERTKLAELQRVGDTA